MKMTLFIYHLFKKIRYRKGLLIIMNYINDINLYNKSEAGDSINVVIEICPGTSDKNELVEPTFHRLQCVRQVIGEYPFYYGSFPQTYAGDADPLDFILFTDIEHKNLDIVQVDVIGAIRTIDAGQQDDKIICVECASSIINVKKHLKKAMKFLKEYKGKNSDMLIAKKLASMADANILVDNAHLAWKERKEAVTKQSKNASIQKNSNTSTRKIRVIKRS